MNMQVTEQANAPSVEERAVAALFGNPAPKAAQGAPPAPATEPTDGGEPTAAELTEGQTEVTTDTETSAAEETFEFELDGQKWAVPKPLEKAFQNNKDYTQKTQELAHQRRVIETLSEQSKSAQLTREFEKSIAQELQQLAAYDSVLSQPLDPNLPQEELLRSMVQRNQWEKQRAQIAQGVDSKHQQYLKDFEKAQGDLKAKALDAVTKRIPGWNDAMWQSIREHAKADGYTDAELASIFDPRHQITLWKAQQYDLNRAKATKVVADVKNVKTTPTNPMPQAVKDKLAFNKALQKATTPAERNKLAEARAAAFFRK